MTDLKEQAWKEITEELDGYIADLSYGLDEHLKNKTAPKTLGDAEAPMNRTLYIRRDLMNQKDIEAWAKANGFTSLVDDPHVTVCFSRTPVQHDQMLDQSLSSHPMILSVINSFVQPLGDKGAVVLRFDSLALRQRHASLLAKGASHDFPEYQPHVTLTYKGMPAEEPQQYQGELVFGPEIFSEINDDFTFPAEHAL